MITFWYSIKYLGDINWEVLPLAKLGKLHFPWNFWLWLTPCVDTGWYNMNFQLLQKDSFYVSMSRKEESCNWPKLWSWFPSVNSFRYKWQSQLFLIKVLVIWTKLQTHTKKIHSSDYGKSSFNYSSNAVEWSAVVKIVVGNGLSPKKNLKPNKNVRQFYQSKVIRKVQVP